MESASSRRPSREQVIGGAVIASLVSAAIVNLLAYKVVEGIEAREHICPENYAPDWYTSVEPMHAAQLVEVINSVSLATQLIYPEVKLNEVEAEQIFCVQDSKDPHIVFTPAVNETLNTFDTLHITVEPALWEKGVSV